MPVGWHLDIVKCCQVTNYISSTLASMPAVNITMYMLVCCSC